LNQVNAQTRRTLFVSHASPDDNDFTQWLALKLIALGYDVWCDILTLQKGSDFWQIIEKEIRDNTCKFLIVLSSTAIKRQGVLNEIATAKKVKEKLKDGNFIIPLLIDENLSFDDIIIELIRLNAVDFKKSWAQGIGALIEALENQNVPKDPPNFLKSNMLYQQIFLHDKGVITKNETYDSNWFPIVEFPEELKFHEMGIQLPIDINLKQQPFPIIQYKNFLCTFASEPFIKQNIGQISKTLRLKTSDILTGTFVNDLNNEKDCKRLLIQIINDAFDLSMEAKSLREYQMSNKKAYWIEKGKLDKDKMQNILLIGKQKKLKWHFGISGTGRLYPKPVLMISSHIFFTYDGFRLVESKAMQHSARRRQGRNWWNDTWRTKLMFFVKYLSEEKDLINMPVGENENICVAAAPLKFASDVSYNTPKNNRLKEEVEIEELCSIDEPEGSATDLIEG